MKRKIAVAAAVVASAVAGSLAVNASRGPRDGCVMRPKGAPVTSCLRLMPDGGVFDFGAENSMPAAQSKGAGCVETACVVSFGGGK